ncbi:MAG: hypothetical protein MJZ66_03645 [Bacteroidales bacterium]|nr:hypothetical protein [Bacteroidales bacterium]
MPNSDTRPTRKTALVALLSATLSALLAFGVWYFVCFGSFQIIGAAGISTIDPPRTGQPRLDTAAQNILLIGDSMAYSLMFRAQNYCNHNGHTLNVVSWVSATSKTYALCDTMEYFVNLYHPTYILFVIGANEMFKSNALGRKEFFDKILPQTHGLPLLVIGPPNWREDTGINRAMMEMFGPRQFFLSKRLRYTRIKGDIVHPDRASGTMWMDSVATWIMRDSFFPIRMERPVEENPIHVDFVKLVLTDPNLS